VTDQNDDETEESLLPSMACLYCSQTGVVYVRFFRLNGMNHLACHCRKCGHRWQMREQ